MPTSSPNFDSFFHAFQEPVGTGLLAPGFQLTDDGAPPEICRLAAAQLQAYLTHEQDWKHNFGLMPDGAGPVIGKMFGVLVVRNAKGELGFLAGFSGKLAGGNHHPGFVPPVFDMLTENSFLNQGMLELTAMTAAINEQKKEHSKNDDDHLKALILKRKEYSHALQNELYKHYLFLNKRGDLASLQTLFSKAHYKNPPSGAGECAGPKLLQYAFQHQLQPLALTEFWWGASPKSAQWKHGEYYDCCKEKCAPILAHMLYGIDD